MKRETYERQLAYAGPLKASMKRRRVGHDYAGRQIYLVTLVTEGRRKLFGEVVGRSDGQPGTEDAPRVALSELGHAVVERWLATSRIYPQVEVLALQVMPDHLHGILFVKEPMEKPLGAVIRGFKAGCNKAYRRIVLGLDEGEGGGTAGTAGVAGVAARPQQTEPKPNAEPPATASERTGQTPSEKARQSQSGEAGQAASERTGQGPSEEAVLERGVQFVAAAPQLQAQPPAARRDRRNEEREHGQLFERGYNDKLLFRAGQLDRWCAYLRDNPRRLLVKRDHPDLFRVRFGIVVAGQTYAAIGNRFLLDYPQKAVVQLSRRYTADEIERRKAEYLEMARRGTVLVSPSISPGEKTVMRAALDARLPLIFLEANGFTRYTRPDGEFFEACAAGRLLILAPWEHHNDRRTITREQCLSLNALAQAVCGE